MLKFSAAINNVADFQKGDLPAEAVKLRSPSSTGEMMLKAAPIAGVLSMILAAAMFLKTFLNHIRVISPIALIFGAAVGFALLWVHELLHAVVYPKEASVTIGRLKGKLIFVALTSYPLKRGRFVLMCLLPFVLGLIPLCIFLLSAPENLIPNGIMFGMACMGMTSPYPDVYNVISVLRQTKHSDMIMFYGDDIYRIPCR